MSKYLSREKMIDFETAQLAERMLQRTDLEMAKLEARRQALSDIIFEASGIKDRLREMGDDQKS